MYTVVIEMRVKPDHKDRFIDELLTNAHASLDREPGCLKFDVHRHQHDENRFLLYEVYVDESAFSNAHRSSPHYEKWRDVAVEVLEPDSQSNSYWSPVLASGGRSSEAPLIVRRADVERIDRGTGVSTLPFAGKWNLSGNRVTTGITEISPGAGVPLHSHNVEEAVLVLLGQATAVVADQEFELAAGDATWVPAGVMHCFLNRSAGPVHIYWTYGGRDVMRTSTATGETVEHLSPGDRTDIVADKT